MPKKTKQAFTWIVNLLRKHKTNFRISGGFAAKIYGSKRSLADIDIEVTDDAIEKIKSDVKEFITYGPKRYKDNQFDLLLMTLKYKGQNIDICGTESQKLFNKMTGKWEKQSINLSKITKRIVFGKLVPVINLQDLIRYKKKLARPVDLEDVLALS